MTHYLPRTLLAAALLAALAPARAENLLDIYHLAQQHDLALQQARAGRDAGLERGSQGTGQLLPTLVFNASHYAVRQDIQQPTAVNNDYDSDAYSLQLTQPLYRKPNLAAWAQGRQIASQAEAEFAVAEGELLFRAAQAYFDVLAAEDALGFARTEKAAIEGQRRLAERNFAVGNASVVDVHEARARYDQAAAQEVNAENDLHVKREALAVLVNAQPGALAKLGPGFTLQAPEPADMEAWNRTGQEQSPLIRVYERALKVAEEEIEKQRGGHYPALDLVASHSYNKNGSVFSPATYEYTTNMIGAQLTVPLYGGGITQSRVREAEARRDQARAALESAKRSTARLARESFVAVTTGIRRVEALEQALASSRKALESTLIGYESGVRTGVDVLNAQRELYRTQRDLSQARYAYLLSQLRLRLAAGTLSEADLAAVNGLLTGN